MHLAVPKQNVLVIIFKKSDQSDEYIDQIT